MSILLIGCSMLRIAGAAKQQDADVYVGEETLIISQLRRAVAEEPQLAAAHHALCAALSSQQAHAITEALASCQTAILLEGSQWLYWNTLGEVFRTAGCVHAAAGERRTQARAITEMHDFLVCCCVRGQGLRWCHRGIQRGHRAGA